MPIPVTKLTPGDRVVLNCPKSRRDAKREAVFEGVFDSWEAATRKPGCAGEGMLVQFDTLDFIASEGKFARFLLQTLGPGQQHEARMPGGEAIPLPEWGGITELAACFRVDADGGLTEEEGRRVFIERRLQMGQG